jgi:hypothetical protein
MFVTERSITSGWMISQTASDQQRRHHGQDECVGPVIAGKGVQKPGITARACDRLAAAEHIANGAKDEDDRDDPEKRHGNGRGTV